MTDLDPIWQKYASKIPGLLKIRPDFRFDPHHYKHQTGAHIEDLAELREYFDAHGSAEGHAPTLYEQIVSQCHTIDDVLLDLMIDPALVGAMEAGQPEAHQLAFELLHLGAPIDSVVSDFSGDIYLRMNADLLDAGINPLVHYLCHGASEGRRILRDLRKGQYSGQLPYRPERPTCLIVVHECSRTGAPIVGRDLAREAAKTHNVIVATLRDGPLMEEFRETSCQVLVSATPFQEFDFFSGEVLKKIDFAIINSVETWSYVPFLISRDMPFAAYIHEYTEYTFPAYKSIFSALLTDLVVFSSDHVRDSWRGRLKDICFDVERDSTIIPQRPLAVGGVSGDQIREARSRLSALIGRDLSEVRLVCGAGHLQWRKGTDVFAMASQICRQRDPETVFIWIGDGLNREDAHFGTWMNLHLERIGAGKPGSNLFVLPAGPAYLDILTASDAMFVSSRLDPLPNVVFDALDHGCRIVFFEGASGFGDDRYLVRDEISYVEYGNPAAAAEELLSLPRKQPGEKDATVQDAPPELFANIKSALEERLAQQRYFVRGASQIDVPMLFPGEAEGSPLRIREREKMLRYGRRLVWRDLDEVEREIAASDNWMHSRMRLAPYATAKSATLPSFALHVHAYYTDDLADDLREFAIYRQARRIVVTTDTEAKGDEIRKIMAAEGLRPEMVLVANTGRDILPFMKLFQPDGGAGRDELWCHLHQKKSVNTTDAGDIWRRFLMRILLGDAQRISSAVTTLAQDGVGLVAPFDPYFISWNESRHLLPKFVDRLPGPMPENPLLFPVGNMFWVRRQVVEAMNDLFGPDYPWPNEPIANDGTEYHLIERLWPAMAAQLELDSVFVHKLDEQRV